MIYTLATPSPPATHIPVSVPPLAQVLPRNNLEVLLLPPLNMVTGLLLNKFSREAIMQGDEI